MEASHLDAGLPAVVVTNLNTLQSPGEQNRTPESPLEETFKALQQLKPDELRSITKLLEAVRKQKELDGETGKQVSVPILPFPSTY
jgi:hypothetical protein